MDVSNFLDIGKSENHVLSISIWIAPWHSAHLRGRLGRYVSARFDLAVSRDSLLVQTSSCL